MSGRSPHRSVLQNEHTGTPKGRRAEVLRASGTSRLHLFTVPILRSSDSIPNDGFPLPSSAEVSGRISFSVGQLGAPCPVIANVRQWWIVRDLPFAAQGFLPRRGLTNTFGPNWDPTPDPPILPSRPYVSPHPRPYHHSAPFGSPAPSLDTVGHLHTTARPASVLTQGCKRSERGPSLRDPGDFFTVVCSLRVA